MMAWDAASGKVAYCIEDAHATRVKGIVVLSTSSDTYTVASASSDGVIHIWDVRGVNKEKTTLLAEANTRSRLNCLAGSSIKCEFEFCLICLSFFRFSIYVRWYEYI